jgi:hypothetical protein
VSTPRTSVAESRCRRSSTQVGIISTKSMMQPRATQRKNTERQMIPRSHYGRIRALAMYGMTLEQVAELYGFPVEEIERIVSAKP